MRSPALVLFASLGLTLSLVGCGDDYEGTSLTDGGADGSTSDGSTLPGSDGAVDAEVDAGPAIVEITLHTQATPSLCVEGAQMALEVSVDDAVPTGALLSVAFVDDPQGRMRLIDTTFAGALSAPSVGPWVWTFDCPADPTWEGSANFDLRFSLASDDPNLRLANPIYTASLEESGNVEGLLSARALSIGEQHVCAISSAEPLDLTTHAELVCWGLGDTPVLGTFPIADGVAVFPPRVVDLAELHDGSPILSTPTAVYAGTHHSCVLDGGALYCFGENYLGQLGVADVSFTVHEVLTHTDDVLAVDVGGDNGCALRDEDGDGVHAAWCWGAAREVAANSSTGTTITGSEGAEAIALGDAHACVLMSDGSVRCWGDDSLGQGGGYGEPVSDARAVVVPGGVSFSSLDAGGDTTCAIATGDGSVYCWGRGGAGQRGDGLGMHGSTPALVVQSDGTPLAGVREVATGLTHTCAVVGPATGGEVWCWGANDAGQQAAVGDDRFVATRAEAFDSTLALDVRVGPGLTCIIDADRYVRCAGWGKHNPRGDGLDDLHYVSRATAAPIGFAELSGLTASGDAACAYGETAGLWCWGYAAHTIGTIADAESPWSIPHQLGLEAPAELVLGDEHACARWTDGRTTCWGEPARLGAALDRTTPVGFDEAVERSELHGARDLDARGLDTCGVSETGEVYCWGYDDTGELGAGAGQNLTTPSLVAGLSSIVEVALGHGHLCARDDAGAVHCLGDDSRGQLGDGVDDHSGTTPITIAGLQALAIAALDDTTCAVTAEGWLSCWGANGSGEIEGHSGDQPSPVLVSDWQTSSHVPATSVSGGTNHGCARTSTGTVFCFGNTAYGQTGVYPGYIVVEGRSDVGGLDHAGAVASGEHFACAIDQGEDGDGRGDVVCWGSNRFGQQGSDRSRFALRPVVAP